MAITRAQQAKQMLQKGGRTGFQGGGRDAATESFAQSLGGQSYADKVGSQFGFQGEGEGQNFRSAQQVRSQIASRTQAEKDAIAKKERERLAAIEAARKARAKASLSLTDKFKILSLKNQIDQMRGLKPKIGGLTSIGNIFDPSMVDSMYTTDDDEENYFEGADLGMTGSELEREQIIKDAITKAYDTGDMTQKEFEDAFYSSRNYSLDDQGNIISTPKIRPTANIGGGGGENLLDPCKGPNPPAYCFVGIRSVEPEVEEEVDMDDRALAFRADGGRIGFRIGSGEGKDVSGREYGGPPGKGSGSNDRDRRRVEQYTKPPKPPTGGGGGGNIIPDTPSRVKKDLFADAFIKKGGFDLINLGLIPDDEQSQPLFADASLNQDELNIQKALGQKTYTDAIKEVLPGGKITAGGGITNTVPDLSNPDVLNKIAIDAGLPTEKKGIIGARKDVATPGSSSAIKSIQNLKRNPDLKFSLDDVIDIAPDSPTLKDLSNEQIKDIYNVVSLPSQNRFAAAEGGMPYEGGIMDLESARQMYGLGKLVKKVTRTVKKIAKSPIGKAALLYAGGTFLGGLKFAGGAGLGSGTFLSNLRSGQGIANLGGFLKGKLLSSVTTKPGTSSGGLLNLIRDNPMASIFGASALAGLLTSQQEEEAQELSRGEGIDIEAARRMILQAGTSGDQRGLAFRAEGGRIGYQEGSKEPVAKKTMPLLDMGGKEMDLREEGGFVPIGRMEKADDVPARLSKNEFVFTADAVRNAGDGDVDKGAEVMYNMMKNLEAGGEVSEESQGLEGARKMFQTSQRLEEVL